MTVAGEDRPDGNAASPTFSRLRRRKCLEIYKNAATSHL